VKLKRDDGDVPDVVPEISAPVAFSITVHAKV
jgi:hypothetical protein